MTDREFDRLCEANSFGAVARNEFPLVPRAMLKALVDAAVSTEILKQQERIKRLEEALEGTVKWFVNPPYKGNAVSWNIEEQSVIIAARAALKKEAKL